MPAKAPLTSIECHSLSHLNGEIASVQDVLSFTETEETWDSIATALSRFAAICEGNANTYPEDLAYALRFSSRPICSFINSERTRLSGTATDFLTTACTALGSAFEPLIPHYLPALFTLCTRTNKVFLNRAKACISVLVEHTQALAIIHHCALSITDKSVTLRLAAAETLMLCMKSFNPPDLEKESRAKEIEACIRATAVDANADVRKVARKIFDAYKILLPGRVQSFTDPMTPTTRKYLDIKGSAVTRSQPSSRPTSSQSVRSTSSETRSVAATATSSALVPVAPHHPPKHTRSASSSQAVSQTTYPKRPTRAPTPEVVAPVKLSLPEAARRVREEPRRLKVNMPPPDYIPARADPGPQRPMSATELRFPSSHLPPSDRATSGPQRVMRVDAIQPGTIRTGPLRPALFNFRSSGPDDGAAGEQKPRVIGGARRVLRVPEVVEAPDPSVEEKGKATAAMSKPIRPRTISTSKSTPAVPLSSAPSLREREDATRGKKLASSLTSSRSGNSAGLSGASTRVGRTASATVTTQATASSRARTAEKPQEEKRSKEKTVEKPQEETRPKEEKRSEEKRYKEEESSKDERRPKDERRSKDERRFKDEKRSKEKKSEEKVEILQEEKRSKEKKERREKERERTQLKTSSEALVTRPATVTMRERPKYVVPKSGDASKPATKVQDSRKTSAKVVSTIPDLPEVGQAVSPAEVPLPVSPKVAPVPEPVQAIPTTLLVDASVQDLAIPSMVPETVYACGSPVQALPLIAETVPSPAAIPLPSSRPASDGQLTPPLIVSSPPDVPEPRTPSPGPQQYRPIAEVEQTPISALVASIQRGFLAMHHKGTPLSPMREEEESVLVIEESDEDGKVFGGEEFLPVAVPPPVRIQPLFSSRSGMLHA